MIPAVFLFTGDSGEEYGYADSFRENGTFWYNGECQVGDMLMVSGNSAIRDHAEKGKALLVFQIVPNEGVQFVGEAEYLTHHEEIRSDRNGTPRKAYVFHLALIPPGTDRLRADELKEDDLRRPLSTKLSLAQLREAALKSVSQEAAEASQRVVNVQLRAEAVKRYALKRANGICESCTAPAPFVTAKQVPYLEVHHLFRLSDGGPDHPDHVIALCPNCHRRAHYSDDAKIFNDTLVIKIK